MQHDFYPSRDPGTGLDDDQHRFLASATVSLGLPSLFYASLRHPRLFEEVVGRSLEAEQCERIELAGFRLGMVDVGTGFPGVFPASQAGTATMPLQCVLVHDLTAFERTMVAWYEWDEYVLRPVPLADGRRAQVFVPDMEAVRAEHGSCPVAPWSYEAWRRRHLEHALAIARQWMAQRPGDAALIQAGFFTPPEARSATG